MVLSLVPTPLITVIIASATPAAIRPYSMAVAAFSSFKNLMTKGMNDNLAGSGYLFISKTLRRNYRGPRRPQSASGSAAQASSAREPALMSMRVSLIQFS